MACTYYHVAKNAFIAINVFYAIGGIVLIVLAGMLGQEENTDEDVKFVVAFIIGMFVLTAICQLAVAALGIYSAIKEHVRLLNVYIRIVIGLIASAVIAAIFRSGFFSDTGHTGVSPGTAIYSVVGMLVAAGLAFYMIREIKKKSMGGQVLDDQEQPNQKL